MKSIVTGPSRKSGKQIRESGENTTMRMKPQSIAVRMAVMLLLIAPFAHAADWPQYRGPNQDGISTETLNPVWPAEGPKLLWKIPVNGYGSFAISGDKVFALTSRDNKGEMRELCVALDAATGKELWAADITIGKYASAADADDEKSGDGPGSTPTVSDGKVYVYSTDAKLCCFDAQTGKELWRVDVVKDHGGAGRVPKWGNSSSPVVDGDVVFVAGGGPGQSVLAIKKDSGQVVWKTEDEPSDFNTPVVTTMHGQRQVIFCLGHKLVGISVKDGKTLWRKGVAWEEAAYSSSQSQPIVYEDKVCYSASGCALFQIVKWDGGFYGKWLWDINYHAGYSTPVLWDGHFYGTIGTEKNNSFTCFDFATGGRRGSRFKWGQKQFGCKASVILVGDKLVVLSDVGDVVVAEPKPDAYKEITRFKAIAGRCWSTPAFSNGRLYVRSSKEGACYEMSAK